MITTPRRSIIKSIFGFPFVAASGFRLSRANATGQPQCEHPALSMVRRLNTLQLQFKRDRQVYGEHAELLEAANVLVSADEPSRELILKSFSSDAVPGWSISLHLSSARDAYLLSLVTTEQVQPNTIVTDQDAVIYFGTLTPGRQLPPAYYAPLKEWYPDVSPLQAPKPTTSQKVVSWARQLAFAGLGGELQPSSNCPCGGTCRSQAQPICCNTGHAGCAWCCYAYCSNCQL